MPGVGDCPRVGGGGGCLDSDAELPCGDPAPSTFLMKSTWGLRLLALECPPPQVLRPSHAGCAFKVEEGWGALPASGASFSSTV